ncbi:hypothetical protein WJX81_000881 [Elliptochloris bilobata]|uniref:Protein N-lysine methyltransferase METTL21A n=1 Tax=Elliptochloris bilobata TaxID=381761 RepID=A0AAW1RBU2_9CHLO
MVRRSTQEPDEEGRDGGFSRWNTHFSTVVNVTLLGTELRLSQDPKSLHLGTTVWDASIVLAKWLERNARKGELSREKLRGKAVLELGAGMGLAGFACALLGARVMLTDTAAVLPLLARNYEANLSPAALRSSGSELAGAVGPVEVRELDWFQPEQVAAAGGPYDFILAADCVYNEALVDTLLRVVLALSNKRTTVVVANELRSDAVQERFRTAFEHHFVIKRVPRAKLDAVHQHPSIDILLLRRRSTPVQAL